jgi:hypothetical protein
MVASGARYWAGCGEMGGIMTSRKKKGKREERSGGGRGERGEGVGGDESGEGAVGKSVVSR